MEMMWDNLVCKCKSIKFVATNELRWKPQSGLVVKPTGDYICAKCGEDANTLHLIEDFRLRVREKEYEDLKAQIAAGRKDDEVKEG